MRFQGFNLQLVPAEQATLPATDLGLRRGFAAFDYLRLVDGRPLFLDDHLDRFERSAALLGLELPAARTRLESHLHELIGANGVREAGVQLFLTGGVSDDGFTPGEPNLLILVVALPPRPDRLYRDGASLLLDRFQRDLPEAKTSNYGRAVRLGAEMRAAGAVDVLYHDGDRALETTRANLFLVDADQRLVTPGRDILPGVTRRNVIRAVDGEVTVIERDVALDELWRAREAFVTSTTKGALPVVEIGGRAIGDGRPGAVTARVQTLFEAHIGRYLERAAV